MFYLLFYIIFPTSRTWGSLRKARSLTVPVSPSATFGNRVESVRAASMEASFLQRWRAILLWGSHLHNDDNVVISWGCWNFAGVSSISSQVTWARWVGKCYHWSAYIYRIYCIYTLSWNATTLSKYHYCHFVWVQSRNIIVGIWLLTSTMDNA